MATLFRSIFALALACAALPACSSDAAPEPEATLETPGAFVAFDNGISGALTLLRTLDTLQLPQETILFTTVYDVDPTSWEEATEIAHNHDIPVRLEIEFITEKPIIASTYRVVWFRTLNEEEKARVP